MSNYTPEEVDMLIEILKTKGPNKRPDALSKIGRTIKYLENRHKFFNPTKEMLAYIINIAENSKLDPVLIVKMKEDMLTKR